MQRAKKHKARARRRVLIVDDHPLVRKGIKAVLEQEPDLEVTAEAASRGQTLEALRKQPLDLVIMDISLESSDGLETTKAVRAEFGAIPILVVSMHDEAIYAERALRAGANGYLMKQEVAETVVKAVRQVLEGRIYTSEGVRQKVLHDLSQNRLDLKGSPVERLSDRELEVFRLIGAGLGTRTIAGQLHLSIKTIETYRAHIKEKLGLGTASELTRSAVQWVEDQSRGGAPAPGA